MHWQLATGKLALSIPQLMGIVNLTPDSFSDGGEFAKPTAALARIDQLIDQGASLIDLGAESTRPGATPIDAEIQLARLMPVLERLHACPAVLTIDTSAAAVIQAVAAHPRVGAINDVRALTQPDALASLAPTKLGICLMHMQGTPASMQQTPHYNDLVGEIEAFLLQRARACEQAGIAKQRLCLDPGFGFGKTFEHNLALFAALPRLAQHGYPLLIGVSRKRMLGALIQDDKADRTLASALTSALASTKGAQILRVHDVAATRQALQIIQALAI